MLGGCNRGISVPCIAGGGMGSCNTNTNIPVPRPQLEACICIMSLCKAGCKGDYIIGRYQAIINAVNKAKAGVKAVREACVECLRELEGLRSRMVAENRGAGEDGEGGGDEVRRQGGVAKACGAFCWTHWRKKFHAPLICITLTPLPHIIIIRRISRSLTSMTSLIPPP